MSTSNVSVAVIKDVKSKFQNVGGIKTGKSNFLFIDLAEDLLFFLKVTQTSIEIKTYTIGNGGTNYVETLTPEEFLKSHSKKS